MDTRVTNAITGGDLAPKITIDLLATPYTDTGNSTYGFQSTQKQLYVRCSNSDATATRTWNYPIEIKKGMKLIYDVTGSSGGGGAYTKTSAIKIGNSNISFGKGTIDLTPYVGQTLTFSATITGYADILTIDFVSMTVTNE